MHKLIQQPEIFTNGFIDILNNGQVNASARIVRLYTGEPERLIIPISLYSGISANNFQYSTAWNSMPQNDHLLNQFINPMSGLVNMSAEDLLFFNKTDKLTRAGWIYHFGERLMSGFKAGAVSDPQTGKPVNFLNSFATTGLYLQTGAWERTNNDTPGICWLALRYHWCYSHPATLASFMPNIYTNGIYTGYSLGVGIDINKLVNLRAIYYKYLKRPEIDYSLPIYQFSFNYSLKS